MIEDDIQFLKRVQDHGYIIVGKIDPAIRVGRVTATVDNESRSFDMTRELMEEFRWSPR